MCKGSYYPCGKCPSCIERKRNAWSIRAQYHADSAYSTYFGLLTYDDEHLHHYCDKETGEYYGASLDVKDVQKCFKRFRKNHGYLNISYMVAGEYSPLKQRPHWHLLMFVNKHGLDNDYQIRAARQRDNMRWQSKLKYFRHYHRQLCRYALWKVSPQYMTHNYLLQSWKLGFAPLQLPNHGVSRCVHYATKYMYHKLQNVNSHLKTPSLKVSKGIGANYLTPDHIHGSLSQIEKGVLYRELPYSAFTLRYRCKNGATHTLAAFGDLKECAFVNRITHYNGHYPLPRYYKRKILETLPEDVQLKIKELNINEFKYRQSRRLYDFLQLYHTNISDEHYMKLWFAYNNEKDRLKREKTDAMLKPKPKVQLVLFN